MRWRRENCARALLPGWVSRVRFVTQTPGSKDSKREGAEVWNARAHLSQELQEELPPGDSTLSPGIVLLVFLLLLLLENAAE